MKVTITKVTNWTRVLNAARMTVHKKALESEPTDKFKEDILFAEHSPIRDLEFDVVLEGIPSFVSTHLVRHTQGLEKFVTTSREDRTGVKRSERKQTDLVDMMLSLNAQAFINISRKRLCSCADPETIKVWKAVIAELAKIEPMLAKRCVRECIYRGFCPERTEDCCGFVHSNLFATQLKEYRTRNEAGR